MADPRLFVPTDQIIVTIRNNPNPQKPYTVDMRTSRPLPAWFIVQVLWHLTRNCLDQLLMQVGQVLPASLGTPPTGHEIPIEEGGGNGAQTS